MAIRFSISPINWTNDDDPTLGGDITLEQCLTEMKEAGYAGCELGNKFPKDQQELLMVLQRFDLELTTDWIGTRFTEAGAFDDSLRLFKKRAQFLKPFGVQALKVCEIGHSIHHTNQPIFNRSVIFSQEQWQNLKEGLRQANEFAADLGMYIAYHHHLGTGIESVDDIDRLMNETDDSICLLPDTGHLFAAGADVTRVCQQYFSRIKYVHLKDVREHIFKMAMAKNLSFMDAIRAGLFSVPSDGCINFATVFSLLIANKFSGWLVVEAEQDPKIFPPLQGAKVAREFLRSYFSC